MGLRSLGTLGPSRPEAHRERTALRFRTKNGPWASLVEMTQEPVTGYRESRVRHNETRQALTQMRRKRDSLERFHTGNSAESRFSESVYVLH